MSSSTGSSTHFFGPWVSEAALALSQQPTTLYVAVKDGALLGFACYDTTAKGFFGPTGVDEAARGQGIGEALLIATLKGMREAGYAYAVIGDPGPVAFYQKRLDALEIPKSEAGHLCGDAPRQTASVGLSRCLPLGLASAARFGACAPALEERLACTRHSPQWSKGRRGLMAGSTSMRWAKQ